MCLASGNKKNLQYWFPFGPDEWVNRAPNARTNSNSNVVRLLFFSRENRKCFYSLTEFFVPHFLLVVFCLVDSLTQALISLEIYEEQERKKEKKKLPGEKGRRRRNQKLEEFIKTIGERTVPFYCFLMMTSLVEKKAREKLFFEIHATNQARAMMRFTTHKMLECRNAMITILEKVKSAGPPEGNNLS